jgi:hypothetical protein
MAICVVLASASDPYTFSYVDKKKSMLSSLSDKLKQSLPLIWQFSQKEIEIEEAQKYTVMKDG